MALPIHTQQAWGQPDVKDLEALEPRAQLPQLRLREAAAHLDGAAGWWEASQAMALQRATTPPPVPSKTIG